jgi:hypothetical protein
MNNPELIHENGSLIILGEATGGCDEAPSVWYSTWSPVVNVVACANVILPAFAPVPITTPVDVELNVLELTLTPVAKTGIATGLDTYPAPPLTTLAEVTGAFNLVSILLLSK